MSDQLNNHDRSPALCGNCGRPIAAKRPECLYCGTPVGDAVDAESATNCVSSANNTVFKQAETDVSGFTVVAMGGKLDETVSRLLANEFGVDAERLPRMFDAGMPLPLIRLDTNENGIDAVLRLAENGVTAAVVDDRDLRLNELPKRIAAIEFLDDAIALIDFNTRERIVHSNDSISIAVEGRIFQSRIDSSLKRSGKGQREAIDERVESEDIAVIDIYSTDNRHGYRVRSVGFDFSCLGSDRSYIATENVTRLTTEIMTRCEAAADRRYLSFRSAFDAAWPLEKLRGAGGLTRANLGELRFDRSEIVSNEMQFLRYSRWMNLSV